MTQAWGKWCECGSFKDGVTSYRVPDGKGCCSGGATDGYYSSYLQDEKGVWALDRMESVDAKKAQVQCCPNT